MTYEDTGMYSCHYNASLGSDSTATDEYDQSEYDSGKLKQYVYVFVNNEENLLLPYEGHRTLVLHFIQSHPATIPCIPTDSRTNVTLWLTHTKDGNPEIIKPDDNNGVTYDPTLGFHFEHRNWDLSSSFLSCKGYLGDRSDEMEVVVTWSFEPKTLQPIIIYDETDPNNAGSSNNNVPGMYNFTLTCSVRTEAGVWNPSFSWKYPEVGEEHLESSESPSKSGNYSEDRKTRFIESHMKPTKDASGGNYYAFKLTVINATLSDQGLYTCVVRTVGNKVYNSSYSVILSDFSSESMIEFETDFYKTPKEALKVNVGTKVKFVINVKGYRATSATSDLYWIKDDIEIAKVLKVSASKSSSLNSDQLLKSGKISKSSLASGDYVNGNNYANYMNTFDSENEYDSSATSDYYLNWKIDHFKSKLIKNQIILEIDSSSMKDSGNYTLVYNSTVHRKSISVFLHVLGLPLVEVFESVTERDNIYYFKPGGKFKLTCNVFSDPSINSWFKWFSCHNLTVDACRSMSADYMSERWVDIEDTRDNSAVVNGSSEYLSLHLSVVAEVSGFYACFGRNNNGTSVHVQPFNVSNAEDGFSVEIEPTGKDELVEGRQVALICRVSLFKFKKIPREIEWTFTQGAESEVSNLNSSISHENYILTDVSVQKMFGVSIENFTESEFTLGSQLVINYANLSVHSGNYTCRVRDENSAEISKIDTNLKITKSERALIYDHNLNEDKKTITATSSLQLYCLVSGKPRPIVKWIKDGAPIRNESAGIEFAADGQRLIISRLASSDSGMYSCLVMVPGPTLGHVISDSAQSDQPEDAREQILASKSMYIKVTNDAEDGPKSASVIILTVVFVVIGSVFVVMAVFMGRRIRNERLQKQELQFFSAALFDSGQLDLFNPDLPLDEQVDLLPYDTRWEIPREKLKLGKTLGQGAFGRVVKAQAIGLNQNYWDDANADASAEDDVTIVAVKMLKERASSEQMKSLMAELKILIHLGRHLNIVNLLAACTSGITRGELLVVVEYCPFGNLRHFLLEHRAHFVDQIDYDSGLIDNTISTRVKVFSLSNDPEDGDDSVFENNSIPGHQVAFAANPNYGKDSVIKYAKINHARAGNNALTPDGRHGSDESVINMNSFDCHSIRNYQDHEYVNTSVIVPDEMKRQTPNEENEERVVTTCDLICYSFQVARGMEYLASRKVRN